MMVADELTLHDVSCSNLVLHIKYVDAPADVNFALYDVRQRATGATVLLLLHLICRVSDSSCNPECTEDYASDPVCLGVS